MSVALARPWVTAGARWLVTQLVIGAGAWMRDVAHVLPAYHGQGLSFTEIGQRTGYSRTAIADLARTYGIPMGTHRG